MIESVAIFAAGMWAGGINVIVGSGALTAWSSARAFNGAPPRPRTCSRGVFIVVIGSVALVKILLGD